MADQLQCGDVITHDATLDNDLVNCPDDGLVIDADNVRLDLRGHVVDGDGIGGNGIEVEEGHSGFRIVNGAVSDFANAVYLYEVERGDVSRVAISRSFYGVITFEASALTLERLSITTSPLAIAVYGSHDNVIRRNSIAVSSSFFGVIVGDAPRNSVERNTISGTTAGSGFGITAASPSDGSRVEDNVVEHLGVGIASSSAGITIDGNVANYNGEDGIRVSDPATTIRRNTASYNGDLGIEAPPGVIDGGGNRAFGNGNPLQCLSVQCR
jgi:parallel beta-helix repeat protein